jgi:predicted cupin superfamily sugar epimerase
MTLPRLSAAAVIKLLNLAPLPGEGGFFVRTYESTESLPEIGRAHV